jgi:hypothetical protein
MRYTLTDLQVHATPQAERMFALHGITEITFDCSVPVRTVLFIHCGDVPASLEGATDDYLEIVGRLYSGSNPQHAGEKHIGKLHIHAYGSTDNPRFKTSVELLEWHADGSFDVIGPDGTRRGVVQPWGEARMASTPPRSIMRLRDVEPFNVPPVDNDRAALFMRHLTGKEEFDWAGSQKPRCMMVFRVEYQYPERCVAHALLFPMDIDAFLAMCASANGAMGDVINAHAIGSIRIEYGGSLATVAVEASPSIPQ